MMRQQPSWAAILGLRDQGRDRAVAEVIDALRHQGRSVGGLVQVALGEGHEDGYDLVNLTTEARVPLARPSNTPTLCNLGFEEEAFALGSDWVAASDSDVVVLPVGKLEAAGRGHWPTICRVFEQTHRTALLVVRPHIAARVLLELPDPIAGLELPASDAQIAQFAAEIGENRAVK